MAEHYLPSDIERSSMSIIETELKERGIVLPEENRAVIHRVIHATADFEYAQTLRFTPGAVRLGTEALRRGTHIVTDTNMAKAGVSKAGLAELGGEVHCFMAEPFVSLKARENGSTRAVAAMEYAAAEYPGTVLAIGNAPTALFKIAEQIEAGLRPALVIAVPVGFVNVVESKERIYTVCTEYGIPAIAAMGRKGGSSVAAAICNALLYTAAGMLAPEKRGWN